jgi:Ca2+-binding RTX toxin-like protein
LVVAGAVTALAGAAVAWSAPAQAETGTVVERHGSANLGTYTVVAADGRENDITVSRDDNTGSIVVEDTGDVITAGFDCVLTDSHRAVCPGSEDVAMVTVLGGDLDDQISNTLVSSVFLDGGPGNDTISSTNGVGLTERVMTGGPGNDVIDGGASTDTLLGGAGTDTLSGNGSADRLDGGPGTDRLFGGEGSDEARTSDTVSDGADVFDGGPGIGSDLMSYAARTVPVTVTLDGVANDGSAGEGDNLIDVEAVLGGAANDTLTGNNGFNNLFGGPGNDTLEGLADTDILDGGDGNDTMSAGPGPVGAVVDSDLFSGGAGSDTVRYAGRTAPVTVTLDNLAQDGVANERDNVFNNVENVEGGAAADTLTGTDQPNRLLGAGGDDTLTGGGGADLLSGGNGNDTLQGVDSVAGNDELNGGAGTADRCNSDPGDIETGCEL